MYFRMCVRVFLPLRMSLRPIFPQIFPHLQTQGEMYGEYRVACSHRTTYQILYDMNNLACIKAAESCVASTQEN